MGVGIHHIKQRFDLLVYILNQPFNKQSPFLWVSLLWCTPDAFLCDCMRAESLKDSLCPGWSNLRFAMGMFRTGYWNEIGPICLEHRELYRSSMNIFGRGYTTLLP